MSKAIVLLKGTAAIQKSINSIQTRGKKLDEDIQLCGLSILAHVDEHNTIDLANNLLKALPKSTRTNTLIAWMEAHGKATYNEKDKAFAFDKTKKTDLKTAELKPWYTFLPEPKYHAISLMDQIKKLVTTAEKRIAENAEKIKLDPKFIPEDKIDLAQVDMLKKMLNAPVAANA